MAAVSSKSPFQELPKDLQIAVVAFTNTKERGALCSVCRSVGQLVLDGLKNQIRATKHVDEEILEELRVRLRLIDPKEFSLAVLFKQAFPDIEKVETLHFNGSFMGNTEFVALLKNFPHLRALDLTKAKTLDFEEITSCTQLESLNVHDTNIEDELLLVILLKCTSLRFLNLGFCQKLARLGLGWGAIPSCSSLRHLVVNYTSMRDEGLLAIVGQQSRLQSLRIAGCKKLTPIGFKALARCPEIESLDVSNSQISDEALIDFLNNAKKLRSLCIYSCQNLTKRGIAAIGGCCQLQSLLVRGTAIGDESLATIIRNCTDLQSLDLAGCKDLTDEALKEIINCSQLTFLDVCQTNIAIDTVKAITEQLKKCRVLHDYSSLYIN